MKCSFLFWLFAYGSHYGFASQVEPTIKVSDLCIVARHVTHAIKERRDKTALCIKIPPMVRIIMDYAFDYSGCIASRNARLKQKIQNKYGSAGVALFKNALQEVRKLDVWAFFDYEHNASILTIRHCKALSPQQVIRVASGTKDPASGLILEGRFDFYEGSTKMQFRQKLRIPIENLAYMTTEEILSLNLSHVFIS